MDSLVASIAQHGYFILFLIVLAESIGLPIPAALGLLVAGGASARGALLPGRALLCGIGAMLIGDNLLFLLGRYTGWWLLSTLCRVTMNPEACILQSADSFYRRGRVVLVFAKFLPGINAMAAPLAGSMRLPFGQFLALDGTGAAIYIFAYFSLGFLFSDFLAAIVRGYSAMGSVFAWVIAAAFVVWFANRARIWIRSRNEIPVTTITPEEAAARANVTIFDVRSHGYYDAGTMRIQGSIRLEPNALSDHIAGLPRDKQIVLYCTCLREATAVRVAQMLAERGIPSAVIRGGLGAWKKAGLPLEPVPADEVMPLPKFS